jgi:hypothetical protein
VKEKHETERSHEPSQGVKEPVPEHVYFRISEGDFRANACEHIVKLKDLVERNAVQKSAHADAEKGSCGHKWFWIQKVSPLG